MLISLFGMLADLFIPVILLDYCVCFEWLWVGAVMVVVAV